MVLFGPAVLAQFARQYGPVGWGYGYGYGFSYGYGWDIGMQAGSLVDEGNPDTISEVAYRFTPGAGTYSVTSIPFEPLSLDEGAVTEEDVSECDDCVSESQIDLPFAFEFFGADKSQYRLSSNGFLLFSGDDDGCCDGQRIPDAEGPNDLIAAAWMDLNDGGSIRREYFPGDPDGVLVIEFARPEYGEDVGSVNVQVHLYEGSDIIEIHTTLIDAREHLFTQGLEKSYGIRGVASPDMNGRNRRYLTAPYGYGYGLMLPWVDDFGQASYVAETDTYEIDADDAGSMFHAGLAVPNDDTLEDSNAFQMNANVSAYMDDHIISFLDGDEWEIQNLTGLDSFHVSTEVDTGALDVDVYAQLTFGVPGDYLFSPVGSTVDVRAYVGGELNGQTLTIARRRSAETEWVDRWKSCTVSEGYCNFEAELMEDYAVTSYVEGTGGQEAEVGASVSLSSPNGGGSYTHGTSQQITWSASGAGIQSIRLSLSTDDGSTWSSITSNQSNDGSYAWTVPDVNTTKAKVLVEAIGTSAILLASDLSDNVFTIVGTSESSDDDSDTSGGGGGGGGVAGGSSSPGSDDDDDEDEDEDDVEGSDTSSTGAGAKSRMEANGDLPDGFPVDSLVKLPDDGYAETTADSTVYYIGLDAKRHPFISAAGYLSWYRDFSTVRVIDGATLASIPIGQPILVRPGTHWVKIVSDPRTYYVEPGYKLRWIKDEATAQLLGGADWNTRIIDVDPSMFTFFHSGADIDTTYLASSWPSGALVANGPESNAVRYYISAGKRRMFSTNDVAFEANGFQTRFIRAFDLNSESDSDAYDRLRQLPQETDIFGFEDALFSLMH